MTGKIHVTIGVVTLAALSAKYPTGLDFNGTLILPTLSLVTAAAGSYAPDIDLGRSHSGMKHKTASKVISRVGGGHRGITHTLLVPAIVGALMYVLPVYFSTFKAIDSFLMSLLFGWEVGYLMHLFADMFNGKGIPLFWPLFKKKVHVADFPSNGFGAWMFAIIYTAVVLCMLEFGFSIMF